MLSGPFDILLHGTLPNDSRALSDYSKKPSIDALFEDYLSHSQFALYSRMWIELGMAEPHTELKWSALAACCEHRT